MNILVAYPLFRPFGERMRARLGEAHELRWAGAAACDDPRASFPDIHVLVTARFPAAWGPRFPSLRLLHAAGAGLDKIDLGAPPPDARVCCTHGHGTAIAEYVIMVMLALLRDLLRSDRELRRGNWVNPQFDPGLPLPGSLAGSTVVILGTGEIGAASARLCTALGAHCIGVNRSGRSPAGAPFERIVPLTGWEAILPAADFLVVAVPLTEETRGVVGPEEIARLRPSAHVINVARGAVVDEAALYDALRRRSIAGAALDVWYAYPPAGSRHGMPARLAFHELDNIIMTPHLSGTTEATFRHRATEIVDNILAFAAGRPLRHEVPRPTRPLAR